VTELVIRPRFYDIGFFPDQYDELLDYLGMQGHVAVVEREVEERSAGATVLQTAYDVAVHVLDEADDALDALVLSLAVWLRGKAKLDTNKGGHGRVFIYGSKSELLREVELSDSPTTPDSPTAGGVSNADRGERGA
jgi:hypothetical protein